MPHSFLVSMPGELPLKLKLTANKPNKLFGKAIVGTYLVEVNKRLGSGYTVEDLESVMLDGQPLELPEALSTAVSAFAADVVHEVVLAVEPVLLVESNEEIIVAAPAPAPLSPPSVQASNDSLAPTKEPALAPPAPGLLKLQRALRALLRAGPSTSAQSKLLSDLSSNWKRRRGWEPPFQRDGVLWHSRDDLVQALRAQAEEMAPGCLEHPYEKIADVHVHAGEGGAQLPSGRRALPAVDCGGARGGAALPAEAAQLMSLGMCCVLKGLDVWPRAMQRWGSQQYLRSNLGELPCQVLEAPKETEAPAVAGAPSGKAQHGMQATGAGDGGGGAGGDGVGSGGGISQGGGSRFSYWREKEVKSLQEEKATGMYRTCPRYAFSAPRVQMKLMEAEDFFALAKKHARSKAVRVQQDARAGWGGRALRLESFVFCTPSKLARCLRVLL